VVGADDAPALAWSSRIAIARRHSGTASLVVQSGRLTQEQANDRLTLNALGGAGDDVLIGGPGNDTIDGGPGGNVVIQSLGADTTTAAVAAGEDWLTTHARAVDGKTVLDVGGKKQTLPRAELTELARGVTSA
jgi:Ca2+-binding RTX toxin-like protein